MCLLTDANEVVKHATTEFTEPSVPLMKTEVIEIGGKQRHLEQINVVVAVFFCRYEAPKDVCRELLLPLIRREVDEKPAQHSGESLCFPV